MGLWPTVVETPKNGDRCGRAAGHRKQRVDQVEYLVNLVGADHVGLGVDLMAGGNWLRDFDATSYPRLTETMNARGLSPEVIRKVLGENWLRLLDEAKVP